MRYRSIVAGPRRGRRLQGSFITLTLAVALEVDDLDLPTSRELYVVVYAVVVVVVHFLSAALIDPWAVGL